MTRYLVQVRLVRLPNPDDSWLSPENVERAVSVPFDSEESPELATSQAFLDAVTKAISLLANKELPMVTD